VALTSPKYNWAKKAADIAALDLLGKRWPKSLKWVVVDHVYASTGDAGPSTPLLDKGTAAKQTDVAFLQYTSGSTSEPKGVVITHVSLAHNLSLIVDQLGAGEDTVVVSWLPQYHDMGLIGSYLGVVRCGGRGFYTSPYTFVKRPASWVEAISAFRGTHMQAPNFAYSLAARKPPSDAVLSKLDLSCVRHMINGAEPVEMAAVRAFYDVFESARLPRGVVFPTYGLAEHTVMVCGSRGATTLTVEDASLSHSVVKEDAGGRELVGCGAPRDDVDVAIVELPDETDGDETKSGSPRRLGDDAVGEIWLRSHSVAGAYWGVPPTVDDFGATLDGKTYLRTGDLGFFHAGELFVCGRLKDLIILRGKNHYPHDIERSVERAAPEDVRPGCVAAFALVETGKDDALVVVAEVRDAGKAGVAALCASVAAAVNREHGLPLDRLVIVKPRSIAKTTSGKIARRRCAKAFADGALQVVYDFKLSAHESAVTQQPVSASSAEPTAKKARKAVDCGGVVADLAEELAQLTNRPAGAFGADAALVDMGADSMVLAQFRGVLEANFGCRGMPDDLFFREDTTLASLAVAVELGDYDEERYQNALRQMDIDRTAVERPNKASFVVENCPCLLVCCPSKLR